MSEENPPSSEGSALLRLVEGLADARARLGILEASTLLRTNTVDAFRANTEEHLDLQDDALAEVRHKLDVLLAQSAREAEARAKMVEEQNNARTQAWASQRETIAHISGSAVSMGLALAATLLGLLAASWSPTSRTLIFAGALLVVALILALQWWSSRPKEERK